ncbi:hypothetical protein [Paraglaciecola sp. 2405UD69-4]|uniref:hypothetical protein n=1 Tax=Paraglaciecola sp. 2405UD69-4 TaxID=3391836 RepID=UPI0039C9004A
MKHPLAQGIKLSLLLSLCSPLAVYAQPIDFNYLEARYVSDNGDGIEVAGSYQLDSNWLAFASYRDQDHGSYDYTNLEVGAGLIVRGLMDHDLITSAALVKREYNNHSDTGIKVSAGVRDFFFAKYLTDIQVLRPVELRGAVNIEEVGDFDVSLELGADYHFHPSFSAGLQFDLGGDDQAISLGARWYY